MLKGLLTFLFLWLIEIAYSVDCWVPWIDTIKFEMVSDANIDVVDSNSNYLKKAEVCTQYTGTWPTIADTSRIWDQAYNVGAGTKYFRQEFEIIGEPIYGYLITGCDDFITTIINGIDVGCGFGNWNVLVYCDVLRFLKSGYNYIRFACQSKGGKTYFAYKLSIESQI